MTLSNGVESKVEMQMSHCRRPSCIHYGLLQIRHVFHEYAKVFMSEINRERNHLAVTFEFICHLIFFYKFPSFWWAIVLNECDGLLFFSLQNCYCLGLAVVLLFFISHYVFCLANYLCFLTVMVRGLFWWIMALWQWYNRLWSYADLQA